MDIQTSPSQLRVDYSRVNQYIGPEIVKPTFWQRFKMGLAKFGAFVGAIGQSVLPVFGPLGAVLGAASYGVRNVSAYSLQKQTARQQYDLSAQPYVGYAVLEGLMDGSGTAAQDPTAFIAPSHFENDISGVVLQSEATKQNMMRGF